MELQASSVEIIDPDRYCPDCRKIFSSKGNLNKHRKTDACKLRHRMIESFNRPGINKVYHGDLYDGMEDDALKLERALAKKEEEVWRGFCTVWKSIKNRLTEVKENFIGDGYAGVILYQHRIFTTPEGEKRFYRWGLAHDWTISKHGGGFLISPDLKIMLDARATITLVLSSLRRDFTRSFGRVPLKPSLDAETSLPPMA